MKFKLALSAIAACTLMSGAAVADVQKNKDNKERVSARSGSAGVANAGPRGATAAGVSASEAQQTRQERRRGNDRMMNDRRMNDRADRRACTPGTASTSTTGAVFTDRRSGSAAIDTRGTASGDGTVRSSSDGEVYSSTDRRGSTADAFGTSSAVAREPTTRPC